MKACSLLLVTVAFPGLARAESWVSDQPWITGLVYSVYDPHYGRLSPEVRRDQNWLGHPLKLRAQKYDKGFGCRGFSIIELNVPEGATILSALVGIDDESSGEGDTYFSVWAEGQRIWQSPALSIHDPPLWLNVSLSGHRQIKLITDAQGYGNGDLADWCNVLWLDAAPPPRNLSEFRPLPHIWYVRPELHPCHLFSRGEDMPVTVLCGDRNPSVLAWEVRDDGGKVVAEGKPPIRGVLVPGYARVQAGLALPTSDLPCGLYRLKLTVMQGDETPVQRDVRFAIIDSHAGKPSSGTIFGVNHHEFYSSYEALAAAGVEWSRQWFCWQWIEPRNDEWHWNWHDERMAAAREYGIKTIGVLGGIGQPAWSSPGNSPEGYQTTHGCPANMADWEDYVRHVAERYKGQIKVWESWNEIMGAAQQGRWGWSVAKYVDLHRRTWRILKEVDPENKLLLSADGLGFVQQCLDAGLDECFDGLVPHPYRSGSTPEARGANYCVGNVGDVASVFDAAHQWLSDHGRPDAQVWATEIGWALTGADWPTVSEETHGQYLPRSYILAQGSGQCANLSWHDFGLGMFGIVNGQAYPRPAILSYAGLVSRLAGAQPVKRLALEGPVFGSLFRRPPVEQAASLSEGPDYEAPRSGAQVSGPPSYTLALWAEQGVEFASLKPPQAMRILRFDWFGNSAPLDLPAEGRTLPVTGRVQYLEGPALDQFQVTRSRPLVLAPDLSSVLAGHDTTLKCLIANEFAPDGRFTVRVAAPEGLVAAEPEQSLTLPWRDARTLDLALHAGRTAAPADYLVPVTIALPDGLEATLSALVRVLAPASLSVEPFNLRPPDGQQAPVKVLVRNNDDRALTGRVTPSVPQGFTMTPDSAAFANVAPGADATLNFALSATRTPTSADELKLTATTSDGATCELIRSLSPTIFDADGNGVADGWKLNAQGGPPEARNLAEASVEPGHAEFLCQKIECTRFSDGWIILHRDGQDHIAKGKRYRVSFWVKQRGLKGSVGVAVYNIVPWESCGIERHFRVGPEWQRITTDFTATRDSDNVRFEFYFTEVGTVWLEGMRLEERQ